MATIESAVTGDRLLGEAEAAEMLGVRKNTLATWRHLGRYSLAYVKIGRSVRYRLADLQAFIAARTVTNTGEASQL